MVSLIIPTLNERESMERLLPELASVLGSVHDAELVIIDDGSKDGTVSYIQSQVSHLPFRVTIVERKERGLATAVIRGFKEAHGDILCVMDADLSHPPALISKLVEAIQSGADSAVGSRRVKGGGVEEWPFLRKMYSYISTWFARPISRGVKDPLSGFFAFKRSVIDGVTLTPIGYKILLEILVKGHITRVVEVPYIFRNRDVGKSKLSTKIALQYYTHLMRLYWYRLTHISPRKVAINCAVLLVTLGVCVGIMEAVYRAKVEKYYYIFPKGLYVTHPTRCYAFASNFEGEIHAREFTTMNRSNSKGLRDNEYTYERVQGVPRVLAIGDSFVSQYPMPLESSFLKIMESDAKKDGKNIEIIAAGVNGYNTIQERLYLEEEGFKYSPDLVLAFFYVNDLASNKEYANGMPAKCVDGRGRLIGKPSEYNDSWWYRLTHSVRSVRFVYFKTKELIASKRVALAPSAKELKESVDQYDSVSMSDDTKKMFEITARELALMRNDAEKIGAQFRVVIVPEKVAIDEREKFLTSYTSVIPTVMPEMPTLTLMRELAKQRISVLDLTPAFRLHKEAYPDKARYFTLDPHWTAEGNMVAAEVLYPYIVQQLEK